MTPRLVVTIDNDEIHCDLSEVITNVKPFPYDRVYDVFRWKHAPLFPFISVKWKGRLTLDKRPKGTSKKPLCVVWTTASLPFIVVSHKDKIVFNDETNDDEWKEDSEKGLLYFNPEIPKHRMTMTFRSWKAGSRDYILSDVELQFMKSNDNKRVKVNPKVSL